ncbi:cardiolipin synthase [Candidatus Mycoplasma haematolamae str. Purdue]|uniref:Cardiolipin synthase n=1 Tax=Mycoplasma haematolamae (strain Purdue) TaxID=1212765 RepID=I7BIE6_MYCHA|nr:phosphatidylserine/phosphatidylglycerophosphate/cardiolipin synthase family protein [Candidatus Mycoplasma haematolamae]AFO51593.1 cardiolipin synthase [Candidatus Mycoplasma haematolamae str. Purdue]
MDKLDNDLLEKYQTRLKRYQDYERHRLLLSSSGSLVTLPIPEKDNVIKYNSFVYRRPLTENNSLRFVNRAKDHITCIVNLIKRAKKFIHMEYYIFSEGYVFNYISKLLARKVQEGVEVRLLVDGWGNFSKVSRKMIHRLQSLGIHYKIFNPLFRRGGEFWWNIRNHNKILIIDNEYALFGSCNISDEYFNVTDKFFPTSELSVLLEGEIVNSLNLLFAFHWNMIPSQAREFDIMLDSQHYFPLVRRNCGSQSLQLVDSSPISENYPIKTNLTQMIFSAKKSIRISTPYFYPPTDLLNSLKIVSQSGVKVQIILPKEADFNDKVLRVHRRLLSQFLSDNIEIYEYFGFNHEKLTIIDDEIIYFGTYNWDYRSLYWNFETAIVIKNKQTTKKVSELFSKRLEKSHPVNLSDLSYHPKIIPNVFLGISRWCRIFS